MQVRGYAVVIVENLGCWRACLAGGVIYVADTGSIQRNHYVALLVALREDYGLAAA